MGDTEALFVKLNTVKHLIANMHSLRIDLS